MKIAIKNSRTFRGIIYGLGLEVQFAIVIGFGIKGTGPRAGGSSALLLGAGDGSELLLGTGSTRQPLLGSGAGLLIRDDGTGLLFWARIMRAIDL